MIAEGSERGPAHGDFGYPVDFYAAITAAVPGLRQAAQRLTESILALINHPFFRLDLLDEERPAISAPGSLMPIFNQAANDVIDLVHDCLSGRGRVAVRTARTLFELLVSLRDVTASPDMDERYQAQFFIGGVQFGGLRREADALPGHEGDELRERLRQLAEGTAWAYKTAIDEYGEGFARGWAGRSIESRATKGGLDGDYETFYRWASSEAHGTWAGMHGHWRGLGRANPVYRIGPALAACPTALIHGLDYFDLLMETVESLFEGADEAAAVREAVSRLRNLFPRYREAVNEIDQRLWPAAIPDRRVAMYGIGPMGTGGWFMHDRERREIVRARPTSTVPDGFAAGIQRLRDAHQEMNVWDGDVWFPFGVSRLVVVAVPDIDVVPVDGAKWQPEEWLLWREFDGLGPHAELLTAEIVAGTAEARLWSTARGGASRDLIAEVLGRKGGRRDTEAGVAD